MNESSSLSFSESYLLRIRVCEPAFNEEKINDGLRFSANRKLYIMATRTRAESAVDVGFA